MAALFWSSLRHSSKQSAARATGTTRSLGSLLLRHTEAGVLYGWLIFWVFFSFGVRFLCSPHLCVGFLLLKSLPPPPPPAPPPTLFAHSSHSSITHLSLTHLTHHSLITHSSHSLTHQSRTYHSHISLTTHSSLKHQTPLNAVSWLLKLHYTIRTLSTGLREAARAWGARRPPPSGRL